MRQRLEDEWRRIRQTLQASDLRKRMQAATERLKLKPLDLPRPVQQFYVRLRHQWRNVARSLKNMVPTGLFARSLIIVIAPIVILQSVVAFVFMERHWQLVTQRLSSAVTRDIAAIIELKKNLPERDKLDMIAQIARDQMNLMVDFAPPDPLPAPGPKPFFDVLDDALSREIARQIGKPFWIDTVGRSSIVEIRILLDDHQLRVYAPRSQAYASNSHIFLIWMVGTSLVLLIVAILFLRNQIKPILQLAEAAESFGKGREVRHFRPRGAREVRAAATAFFDMRRRIERQIDQRTTMLAGVSHDLRTVLTRFKLEIALLPQGADTEALSRDADEMTRMVEAYLAFARDDSTEPTRATNVASLINELASAIIKAGTPCTAAFDGNPVVMLRPDSFRRCLTNLVINAARHGENVAISGERDSRYLLLHVDDDGNGIPEDRREDVFKPFLRLDDARNQDEGGTGLGLSIARDIARAHGGDIALTQSAMGGLRATVRIPV